MINFKNIVVPLFLLLTVVCPANGQGFLKAQGKVIINDSGDTVLLRGMGLGGWMLQEGYMLQTADFANPQYQIKAKIEQLIGPADTKLFYDTWLANHVRKIDIDSLKAWGFNSVRLPMHYNLFTLPIEEEPLAGQNTWLDKGFELTDSLISWCAQNKMYAILDLHAAPGGQGYDQGISDYDPTKPSLWESQANRKKTADLWKKLAERYANEQWVGGYDILNEPNWNLNNNTLLRNLYGAITDSIRSVDDKHIIFIEGNWFANDFTGLTPPWDDNLVYAPHKYWSINDQASIQWVLDIQNSYDVPLYLGESGENSNTWFRDAIKLLESHNIGWAWWPMKKVESISCPLSVVKSPNYQTLLNYWSGTGSTPSAAFAKGALMELAENLKLENCVYQRDVIHAMFSQVNSNETAPYRTQNIPGVVYATDFDMGASGFAYFDTDLANYHVSTGNYTAWNKGWAYRNDGVDIETTTDNTNSNGYNVGWLGDGEWMQYDIDVAASALYDIHVRVASTSTSGRFHFSVDGADITNAISTPNTGGWQNWQNVIVPNVVMDPGDHKLRFHVDKEGFNLMSFRFVQKNSTSTVSTVFQSATTADENTVQLNLNKPLDGPIAAAPANFQIFVNSSTVSINSLSLNANNPRTISFVVDHTFQAGALIQISYSGNQIYAQDGTDLKPFSLKLVQNTIAIVHPVPGKVEAEEFFFQSGIQLETSTDIGGGQNISNLDVGDYLDFYLDVDKAGLYNIKYRTAAQSETGQIQLLQVHAAGYTTVLHTASFSPTGGWQTWTNTYKSVNLVAGKQHIRMVITKPSFNMNWLEFSLVSVNTESVEVQDELKIFPNPSTSVFYLQGQMAEVRAIEVQVYNIQGQAIMAKTIAPTLFLEEIIDLRAFPDGDYFVMVRRADGRTTSKKVVKIGK